MKDSTRAINLQSQRKVPEDEIEEEISETVKLRVSPIPILEAKLDLLFIFRIEKAPPKSKRQQPNFQDLSFLLDDFPS